MYWVEYYFVLFGDTVQFCFRVAVTEGLHPAGHYQQVALVRLVGMLLFVFVQRQHVQHLRFVATETVGTGIMGKMVTNNKIGLFFNIQNQNKSIFKGD